MQEKVEKFIYFIKEDKYRVKFLKVDKKTNKRINFDQYVNGTLEDARKVRDEKLKENGLTLENKKEVEDIFSVVEKKEKKKVKSKTEKITKSSNPSSNPDKVDKYIYEIDKGKKYRIFIRKGGSNGQKGDYYSEVFEGTLAQARKVRDKRLAELKLKNGKTEKGSIKFIDFARIYYNEYADVELSPTTVTGGKMELKNYVLPYIGNMPLNKIDALTIQRLINDLKERDKVRKDKDGNTVKLSPTSVNNVYRLIRKILNKAIAWDYIETNPVLKVKAPGVSKVEKKSYNRNELLTILELLKDEPLLEETMFTIAICSGLRRGELVGLHIEDIDLNNNIISVKRAVVWNKKKQMIEERKTKTKNSVRDVPIPLFCTETIKEYLKLRERIIMKFKRRSSEYIPPHNLFLGINGGIMYPDTPSGKWLYFRKRHPELKNVSLHGLRHSYCTMQMNDNTSLAPVDVQKLMGHSQLTTTFIYTHSNEDKTSAAISIFDEYYNKAGEKKINFNEILSLYTEYNFITTNEKSELLKYLYNCDENEIMKDDILKFKNYVENRYPVFKKIDVSNINLNNIWDWLEDHKKKIGNEFIICPIK